MKALLGLVVMVMVSSMGIGALLSHGPEIHYTSFSRSATTASEYWSDDIRLTDSPLESRQASAVMDGDGNLHVMWSDSRAGEPDIYYKKVDPTGKALVKDTLLSPSLSGSIYPSIALDAYGYVHGAWLDDRGGVWNVYYARLSTQGEVMVSGLQITNIKPGTKEGLDVPTPQPAERLHHVESLLDVQGLSPSIDIDADGNAHIAWCDFRTGNAEVHYTVLSSDGVILTDQMQISKSVSDSFGALVKVWGEEVVILWGEHTGDTDGVYFTRIDMSGNVLVKPTLLLGALSRNSEFSVAIDGNGAMRLMWSTSPAVNPEIYYAMISAEGEPLGPNVRITQTKLESRHPSIAVDANGDNHMVWCEEDTLAGRHTFSEIHYLELSSEGAPLVQEQRLTQSQYRSWEPVLAISKDSQPTVVWSDTRNGPQNAELYFKTQVKLEVGAPSSGVAVQETPGIDLMPVAIAIGGTGVVIAVAMTEIGRYKLALLAVPLYSRLKKESLLNHSVREQIFGYVISHPGANFSQIMKELNLKNGVLAYHLTTLEREELIRSMREGTYRKYYPRATVDTGDEHVKLIISRIDAKPGVQQSELAADLNMNRQALAYHIGVLIQSGKVRIERRGKRNLLFTTHFAG